MKRLIPHIALAILAVLPPALARADGMSGMHPGLDDFRPGIGNELYTPEYRRDPYGMAGDGSVPYSRIFPERSGLDDRNPAVDPQGGCRSLMTDAPDATGRMAHWRATQCFDANGRSYILPGSQRNLGYY